MKKILLLIIMLMSCVTMYFIVFWQPEDVVVNSETKNISEENRENKKTDSIEKEESTQKKETTQKEDEKTERKRLEEEKKEMEAQKEEEKNKNLKVIEKINIDMNKEDRLKVENILNELSTVDLMNITNSMEEGNIDVVKKIIKERLLEEESNLVFEIFAKYK